MDLFLPGQQAYNVHMVTISLELPEPLAEALKEAAIETGSDARELALVALREFLARKRYQLIESQQLEDIAWVRQRITG